LFSVVASLLLAAACVRSLAAPPADDVARAAAEMKAGELHQVFLQALVFAGPAAQERHMPGSDRSLPPDWVSAATAERRMARALPVCAADADATAAAARRFVEAQLVRHRRRWRDLPTSAALQRFFEVNRKHYPPGRTVTGWRLAIPDGPGAADDAEATAALAWVKGRLMAGISLPQVCAERQMRTGDEVMGAFSSAAEGMAPGEFDYFFNLSPGPPYSGPVRIGDAWIYGRTDSRFDPVNPLKTSAGRLLTDYLRVRDTDDTVRLERAEAARRKPRRFAFETTNALALNQPAYEMDGTTVTYAEVVRTYPMLLGNKADPAVLTALVNRALSDDLVRTSAWSPPSWDEWPEHEVLCDTLAAASRIEAWLDEATSAPTEAQLQAFLDSRAGIFRPPDLVRLLTVSHPAMPVAEGVGASVARAQRAGDFATLRRVRADFIRSPTTATLEAAKRDHPALEWSLSAKPVPVDELGRVLELATEGLAPGGVSEALADGQSFVFAQIVSREGRPVPTLAPIRARVADEWRRAERERLCRGLAAGAPPVRAGSDSGVPATVGVVR
jgi:hypothetical protein